MRGLSTANQKLTAGKTRRKIRFKKRKSRLRTTDDDREGASRASHDSSAACRKRGLKKPVDRIDSLMDGF
jgi:hypothetical protein